jgi:hypothetical protein
MLQEHVKILEAECSRYKEKQSISVSDNDKIADKYESLKKKFALLAKEKENIEINRL